MLYTCTHTCEELIEILKKSTRLQEVFVGEAVTKALRLSIERAGWPSKSILRRWTCFTERLLAQRFEGKRKVCRRHELAHPELQPQPLLKLPMEAFDVFLHCLEDRITAAKHLETAGLVRDNGDSTVTFWCAAVNLADPMIRLMLDEARRCRDSYALGQIRVGRAHSDPSSLVIKFKATVLTLQMLRARVEGRFGIKPPKQILQHKGQVLAKRGLLYDLGVRRGSLILVYERDLTL